MSPPPVTGPRVIGLDLSVRSTGVGRVFPDGKAWTKTIETWKGTAGVVDHDRIEHIRGRVRDYVNTLSVPTDLVVIEGDGAGRGGHDAGHQLAGLRAIISHDIAMRGIPYVFISPSTLKLFATGHGRYDDTAAGKAAMLAAARAAWPTCDITNDDEADALWLSAAGLYRLGVPVAAHTPEALDVVRWPELGGVAA